MIVLIDNYDSFSYNVYQLVSAVYPDVCVVRNDQITVEEIQAMGPGALIMSPGPGRPRDSGICPQAVRSLYTQMPILGICLGHQVICEAFGGTVSYAKQLMHGKSSEASLDTDSVLFRGLPQVCTVGRYHSLALKPETLPQCLKVTAKTADEEIMAVEHRQYPVFGLQFHPESILTPDGKKMIENFMEVLR